MNYNVMLSFIMRTVIFTFLLFGVAELLAQDSTSFEFWERKILQTENFENMRTGIQRDQFEVLNDKTQIPESLIELLSEHDPSEQILGIRNLINFSNPDEKYRSTDVVYDAKLPSRQIMLLAKNSNQILLTYKHGGMGHHHHILWCELTNNQVTGLWIGYTFEDMYTVNDVIRITDTDPKKLNTNLVCK